MAEAPAVVSAAPRSVAASATAAAVGGGGGGVGGGGGGAGGEGGGGGFGGGGGSAGASGSGTQSGGSGGFGGGGGAGPNADGAPGFGGGTPSGGNGGGGAGMGGAIFNMQGHLTIRASTLTRNVAVGGIDDVPDHAKGIGGAVFNLSGSVTAAGSTFAANTAPYDGSSIYNLVYDGEHRAHGGDDVARHDRRRRHGRHRPRVEQDGVHLPAEPGQRGRRRRAVRSRHLDGRARAGHVTGSPLTADPLLGALRDNGGPTATMAPAAEEPRARRGLRLRARHRPARRGRGRRTSARSPTRATARTSERSRPRPEPAPAPAPAPAAHRVAARGERSARARA